MKPIPSTRDDFRHDINGLRAWAVVAVVLYHFGVQGFAGGFVGVDVFFVISGYLMTGIVVVALERDRFSIAAFYVARARRLLPALLALCTALLVLGWWFLVPPDYISLGKQVVFSVLFLSNIKFWREAGYLDPASHEKLLLHTWSLAVEWQFYFLLPILLAALWKWRQGRRPIAVILAVGAVVSFALCAGIGGLDPSTTFYLLPTRAWEMFAGGLVYLSGQGWQPTARQSSILELGGFVLISGATVAFGGLTPWPGWYALVPVVGTAAILLAARTHSFLTGNGLAQWLGTRSYSLYLWHWPLAVALGYWDVKSDTGATAAGLLFTLVLGHLSYHIVEVRTRLRLADLTLTHNAAILSCLSMAVGALGVGIKLQNGVSNRFPSDIELIANESTNHNPDRDRCFTVGGRESNSCMYGGVHLRAVLLGDSHADAVTTALATAVPDRKDGIMEWSYTACPTMLGVKMVSKYTFDEACGAFLDWATARLSTLPTDIPVIVINRSAAYAMGTNGAHELAGNKPLVYFTRPYTRSTPEFLAEFSKNLTQTACTLSKGRQVYLVRPIPEMGVDVPIAASRAALRGKHEDISISLEEYHKRNSVVWAAQNLARERCGVKILDPLPYLCPDGRCHGAKDGRPIYYDDNHLSEYGNKLLVPMFAKVFERG